MSSLHLIEVSNSVSISKTTAFNERGQATGYQQVTGGQTYQTLYHYNSYGFLTGETYPSGREIKYDYNQNGDLSRVSGQIANGCTINCLKTYANAFNYNSAGAVEKLRFGNGKWETAKFNSRLQIIEIGLGHGSMDASLWKTSYEYGELQTNGTVDTTKNSGNVAKQTLSFAGLTNSLIQTYKYDSLDRLTEAEEKSNNQQIWIQQFGYDRYGNRTSFNQFIGAMQTNTTPAVDANTNRFTTGQGYGYDLNGNLITDAEGRQFAFNGDNKQTEVKDSQDNLVGQYFYDGEGKRIKKITAAETTIFVYNGLGQLIAEYSTQTNSNPTTSYLTNDNLGSPRVITDSLGQVISRRDFMPFGEEIYANLGGRTTNQKYTQSGVDNIRKRFTGYEKDMETGLDFAEARYYHNGHGRFTAVDPLLASGKSANPQTFNRYIYTMNNPTNLVDPSGMISETTGACGNRCMSSGPTGGYSNNYLPYLSDFALDWANYTLVIVKTSYTVTSEVDQQKAQVTTTITENYIYREGSETPVYYKFSVSTGEAVNIGNKNFSVDQLATFRNVVNSIVYMAMKRDFDIALALAIGKKETQFGLFPSSEGVARKKSDINPMQISASSGKTAIAPGQGVSAIQALDHNVNLAMEVYEKIRGGEMLEKIKNYNGERYLDANGLPHNENYATDVNNYRDSFVNTKNETSSSFNFSLVHKNHQFPRDIPPHLWRIMIK